MLAVLAGPTLAAGQETGPVPNERTVIRPASPEICALLDIPEKRGLMDGLLFNLAWSCGRAAEFLGPGGQIGDTAPVSPAGDVEINDPSTDVGHPSLTQSETSLSQNLDTGTLCSGFNDSCEFFCPGGGGGFTGFSRSTDGGATWTDGGAIGGVSFGDPSLAWREADGHFYMASLSSGGGLNMHRSTDDCQTFTFVSTPATGGDDKELIAIDNSGSSPHFGNIYLVWTDFGAGGQIRAIRSTDAGSTWSAAVNLSSGASVVQGAWPAVAPNGDVFVAWVRYTSFTNGPISIDVARSTDGGLTYSPVTSPLVNAVSPRDASASSACFRPSLNGNIRYLASPQIAVDGDGDLHIVYSYDPDGFNVGDVVNVYYRQSQDSGATWGPEIQLNDDTSSSDQYFPTVQVSQNDDTVMASWYDRRLDPGNLLQDYYKRVSTDGGSTWHPSTRLSDVSSPVVLDGSLATCYHGDYDQSIITASGEQIGQWADDRLGHPNVLGDVSNELRGSESGDWTIPTAGDESFSGTLIGGILASPEVYILDGTATVAGAISGTLTPVDGNTPPLEFAGIWQLDGGSTTTGTFRARITDPASPTVSGRMTGRFRQTGAPPGGFRGRWAVTAE
jgi:hypothetical protein